MFIAVAANSASNKIAVVVVSIVMVAIGTPLAINYKGITSRLAVDAIERAGRVRASLRLDDQDAFKEKWTIRQIVFGRIFGASLLFLGIISILLVIFVQE